MITGVEIQLLNLEYLDQPEVMCKAHIYHLTDGGVKLGGAWSRDVTLTLSYGDPLISGLSAKVLDWVLPLEKRGWKHFPEVASVELYHLDIVRYGHDLGWGLAVSYHRKNGEGQTIAGFDGSTLFEVRQAGAKWIGGDCAVSQDSLNELIGSTLVAFEAEVCRVLGIGK